MSAVQKNTTTEIEHVYQLFDINANNSLPKAVFVDLMRCLKHIISNEEAKAILKEFKVTDSFSVAQFKDMVAYFYAHAGLEQKIEDIFEICKIFDESGDYTMSRKAFAHAMVDFGEALDAEHVEALMKQVDPSETGIINFKTLVEELGAIRDGTAP